MHEKNMLMFNLKLYNNTVQIHIIYFHVFVYMYHLCSVYVLCNIYEIANSYTSCVGIL